MTRAKHPGRTPAQRDALDEIGCGNNSPFMAKSTRDAMLKAGLIHRLPDSIIGTGWPRVRVERFEMPIPVHMQWCAAQAARNAHDGLHRRFGPTKRGGKMSQRTIVEFNHDFAHDVGQLTELPELLHRAMASGTADDWEPLKRYGITRVVQLNHSDDRKVVTKYGEYPIG